ncbi:Similar to Dpep3: Dipeptidase 3 (Mus musculus), partial [Cotesia congregata]
HICNVVEDTRALKPQEVALYELNIYVSGDAKRIHDSFGHNDLPWNIRKFLKNQLRDFQFDDLTKSHPWSHTAWSHTDLRRLKEGMVAAQFWSAYVPCSSQHLDSVQYRTSAQRRETSKSDWCRGWTRSWHQFGSAANAVRIGSQIPNPHPHVQYT